MQARWHLSFFLELHELTAHYHQQTILYQRREKNGPQLKALTTHQKCMQHGKYHILSCWRNKLLIMGKCTTLFDCFVLLLTLAEFSTYILSWCEKHWEKWKNAEISGLGDSLDECKSSAMFPPVIVVAVDFSRVTIYSTTEKKCEVVELTGPAKENFVQVNCWKKVQVCWPLTQMLGSTLWNEVFPSWSIFVCQVANRRDWILNNSNMCLKEQKTNTKTTPPLPRKRMWYIKAK